MYICVCVCVIAAGLGDPGEWQQQAEQTDHVQVAGVAKGPPPSRESNVEPNSV